MIDGHVFMGKSIYMENDSESIIKDMDRLGIDISIVVAPPPGPFYDKANEYVEKTVKRYPNRLVALFRANPHLDGEVDKVRIALSEKKFKGIQLDPTNDGYGIFGKFLEPMINQAKESGAPIYVHSGDSIFCPPESVAYLADQFRDATFVTNSGRRAFWAFKGVKNIYLMTRSFPTLAFLRGNTENIDVNRLIFSTDSPLEKPEIELKRIELAKLSKETMDQILGGNIRAIMDI